MGEKWKECLEIIRQEIKDEWIMTTWFECITCESFDTERRVLMLGVPSKYVVEFVEHFYVNLLKLVLNRVYGEGVTLQYHLQDQQAPAPVRDLSPGIMSHGIISPDGHITIANAKERLQKGLQHFLGDKAQWLPDYDEIADWLSDNKGRGLLLVGTSGLGKSIICQKILPVLLGSDVAVVSAREMGQQIDTLLQQRCVIIDNLGREPITEMVNYRKRQPFFELCDESVRRGILLIVNTTFSTSRVRNPLYPNSIKERYGDEVYNRLRAITHVVELRGQSMWG